MQNKGQKGYCGYFGHKKTPKIYVIEKHLISHKNYKKNKWKNIVTIKTDLIFQVQLLKKQKQSKSSKYFLFQNKNNV